MYYLKAGSQYTYITCRSVGGLPRAIHVGIDLSSYSLRQQFTCIVNQA